MEGKADNGNTVHSSARSFPVISCPRPLDPALQTVGMWGWGGTLGLGETLEAGGGGKI